LKIKDAAVVKNGSGGGLESNNGKEETPQGVVAATSGKDEAMELSKDEANVGAESETKVENEMKEENGGSKTNGDSTKSDSESGSKRKESEKDGKEKDKDVSKSK
jgi:hypothetical protein